MLNLLVKSKLLLKFLVEKSLQSLKYLAANKLITFVFKDNQHELYKHTSFTLLVHAAERKTKKNSKFNGALNIKGST